MRLAIASCAFLLLASGSAIADPPSNEPMVIQQNAKTNYAIIQTGKKAESNLRIEQTGRTNAINSVQNSPDINTISTAQRGNWNTVVIYQEGYVDQSGVVQQGPKRGSSGGKQQQTGLRTTTTDDGYLTYFTSGGFSMATLTEHGTPQSRFGRSR